METEVTDSSNNLFADVRYFLINSTSDQVEQQLKSHGAQEEKYLSSFITHVICDDPDNSDYLEAKDVFDLIIIKSDWVTKCLFTKTLLPVEAFSPDPNRLFSNLKAVNLGLSESTARRIYSLISFYGGQLVDEVSSECTHVFADSFTDFAKKLEEDQGLVLVTPDWVVECITRGELIEAKDFNPKYLLSDPMNAEIEQKDKEAKQEEENLAKQAVIMMDYVENKPVDSIKKSDRIIELRKSIESFQHHSGDETVKSVNLIKLVSPKPVAPLGIVTNRKESISIVDDGDHEFKNLSASSIQTQLENTIRLNQTNIGSKREPQGSDLLLLGKSLDATSLPTSIQTTPPKQKLTQKRARKHSSGISPNAHETGCSNNNNNDASFSIDMDDIFATVLSNVKGKQNHEQNDQSTAVVGTDDDFKKQVLENNGVIPICTSLQAAKSLQTPTISFENDEPLATSMNVRENSHLLQFDRCLLGCVFMIQPSEAYYTPDCLDDWKDVIEKFGGRVVTNYDESREEITHVLAPNRFGEIYKRAVEDKKRTVTAYWLEDVLQEQKLRAPWLAYHFPSPYQMKIGPLTNYIITTHGFLGREKLIIKTIIWLLNGKYSSYLMNISSLLISKKTSDNSEKLEKAKKWNINIVNGVWLMELYLGNTFALGKNHIDDRYTNLDVPNHFGYDMTLVSDYMEQWKSLIKLPLERIREVQSNIPHLKPINRSPQKRRRRSESPENCKQSKNELGTSSLSWDRPQSSIPIVMFTGFLNQELIKYRQDLISLNGIMATQCCKATHLIVKKMERTAKVLKCISTCDHILSIDWLIDSKAEGVFKETTNYEILDEGFETYYSCCLRESLQRARTRKLLNGFEFYLTPSVRPSYSDLEEMIKNAGGIVLHDVPTLVQLNEPFEDLMNTGLTRKYVVIGSQKDLCILKPFFEKKIPVYHEELILSGVLRQELNARSNVFHQNLDQ